MSPATNGKVSSTSTGVKRRANSTSGTAKKKAKKGPTSKTKDVKENGSAEEAYEIIVSKPDGWDKMNLYKSFLLTTERFELGDTIFVNSQEQPEDEVKEDEEPKTIDDTDNTLWVAHIIEVRAQNAWNVWVRIEWFYRPDELPGGRQPYHGRREVIKSPVQDIISAHTVAGHADVTQWEETDDNQDADGIDGLFWRQTFDPASGKLSEPRLHCICRKPYNPDTTMFWCDKCKIWEHEKCLADDIRKSYVRSNPPPAGKKPRRSLIKTIKINIAAKPGTTEVTATIHDLDRSAKPPSTVGADGPSIKQESDQSTDDGGTTELPVNCLKCGTKLT